MKQKDINKRTRTAQSHRSMTDRLLLLTLLLFTFIGGAKAQDQLTIPADGTTLTTNQYIPLYGYYADTDGCTSEFIIPAESIEDMADGDITAMTFYISQAAEAAWGATFQVYLGEVNGTTLSENYGPTDFTVVYEGELDGTGTTMTIEFEEPYHYNGGNLLVGTYVLSSGTFKRAYFSGYEATGAAYYSYESSWGNNDEVQNFIPKTTFTYEPAQQTGCAKPTGFAVNYNGGTTATVTWNGTASQYDIDVNGTVTEGVTSPYTLTNLELATTYQVKVRANCGGGEYSDYTSTKSFTTDACLPEDMCSVTIELNDAYGDGGGTITVVNATTNEVLATITNSSSSTTVEVSACSGTQLNFVFASTDSWSYENGWVITDPAGEVISEHVGCSNSGSCTAPTDGTIATYTMNCSGCSKPKDLQATNITTNGATLSWTGNSESYVLQYSPWSPTGDDVLPTGTLQPYTFDLSQFSGTGAIVIRHYDVTNMFRLNIDDIVVRDANNEVVYSQDFENCGGVMPSEFTMMDMDGDGYNWYVVSSGKINGSYGLSSASWVNGDALFPDNWLVLSGIELGGSISFQACGQDASFAAENFNVYVCPDSEIVEKPAATNSYDVTGLPPYTPVAWQVKGICDTYPSSYVSSFFTTLDDVLIFTEEGNWDDLGNWTDVTGNAISALPAITNKVRIDANVTIPAGVVAYAKKIVLNGGTVTIADGGQLKQESTSEVIIKKHINGYGDSNNNWYFIASPLTTTMLEYSDGWSYVNALTGEYDLYAFDATASGLEWINFKSSSTHAAFTSGNNNPVLVAHTGYLYANSEDMDLEFEGATAESSYNKVLTDDFTYEEGATYNWNGWALVGNPFTCNAYISYVDADGIALEADFYTLNTDNTYSLMSSSDALAPCTGAFINYAATGKIQYSTEAPAKGMGLLNMTLSQNRGRIDQARIRFGEGFNLGKMNFRDSSKLYIQQDNVDYGVVYTENSGEMPVSFKAEANGTYTISFNAENVSFNYLRLIDNLTGTEVDLLANPSYTFSASTSDYACRFKLVFGVNTGVGEITDAPFAFISNGNLLVNGEGTLQMVDMMGRVLSTEQINGSYSKGLNVSAGVYVLRLTNGNDVKTQKIVVE